MEYTFYKNGDKVFYLEANYPLYQFTNGDNSFYPNWSKMNPFSISAYTIDSKGNKEIVENVVWSSQANGEINGNSYEIPYNYFQDSNEKELIIECYIDDNGDKFSVYYELELIDTEGNNDIIPYLDEYNRVFNYDSLYELYTFNKIEEDKIDDFSGYLVATKNNKGIVLKKELNNFLLNIFQDKSNNNSKIIAKIFNNGIEVDKLGIDHEYVWTIDDKIICNKKELSIEDIKEFKDNKLNTLKCNIERIENK